MESFIEPLQFVRKLNSDWTFYSYCSRCFATVADSESINNVDGIEEQHRCDPRLLEMVERYRQIGHHVSAA